MSVSLSVERCSKNRLPFARIPESLLCFEMERDKKAFTFGQPKYRLFLLCEGNGDGSDVHFLDSSKHEGYRLESIVAADLIKKSVNFLRFSLQASFFVMANIDAN